MSNAPSYADDIFEALGIPSDPKILDDVGIDIVDPIDHGDDYPFKLYIRRLGDSDHTEYACSMATLPDLRDWNLELIVFAQILRSDHTLSKILLARSTQVPVIDPTKMMSLGTKHWTQFPSTGVELRCIPVPLTYKVPRRINAEAEKRCGNCTRWDRRAGYEEYTRVTHEDQPFGGDRQMWKDVADKEALDRKIRRLDPGRVGLCLEHNSIVDQDMESCIEWEAE